MPGETSRSILDMDTIRKLKEGANDVDAFYGAAASPDASIPESPSVGGLVDDSEFQKTLRGWKAAADEVDSEERAERVRALEEARRSLLGDSPGEGESPRGGMLEVVASTDSAGTGEGGDVLRLGDGSGVPSDNKSAASEKPITGEVNRGKFLGEGMPGEDDVSLGSVETGGRRQVSGLVAGFEKRIGKIKGDVNLKVEIRQDILDKIRELEERKAAAESIEADTPLKRMTIKMTENNIEELLRLLIGLGEL